jgi:hypothetical protein
LIASSLISSAQYGHFFISLTSGLLAQGPGFPNHRLIFFDGTSPFEDISYTAPVL